ncbi:MAG TPA: hypothetical protein VNU19_05205 [Candidatus Acidoferrum sp.]|nr:hypothetical protein [Candidatus Acidoferrum sp.]
MTADLNELCHSFISSGRVLDPVAAAEGQLKAQPALIPHLDPRRPHVGEIDLLYRRLFAR